MWNKLFEKLKNPSVKMLVILYPTTLLCIVWTMTMLAIGPVNLAMEIISYVSYAFGAVTLAYSIYTVIATKAVQRLVRWGKMMLEAKPMTKKLVENYDFRTLFFSACSLSLTFIYAAFNAVVAILGFLPVWHGALAGYYIFLVSMRIGVLHYRRKEHRGKTERVTLVEARQFRNCGILLVATTLALLVAIGQMVLGEGGFEKNGHMIYVTAAYTVVKAVMSIRNFMKAKRTDDYTLQTLRNVNLADTAVSVLALQTAMFHSFGTEGVDVALFNALTGAGTCAIVLALGIYMIVKGNKGITTIREEGYERKEV